MLALLLTGCLQGHPTVVTPALQEGDPIIDALWWECDEERDRWRFVVNTEFWTGGGTVWMGRDVETAEKHSIRSEVAAGNGAWDCLELSLNAVADWRDAVWGSSTRWRCSDVDELSFQVRVQEASGEETGDCRTFGVDAGLWADEEDELPDCEESWPAPVEGEDEELSCDE